MAKMLTIYLHLPQSALTVWILSLLSLANAAWTFLRKRHYRLFEAPIDTRPSTPSARRVKVDSSPASSSPLRFLSGAITPETSEARAHPDSTKDVWELRVWDPKPSALQIYCFFSPGHVLVYWLFLPTVAQDPTPSTTIATTILLTALLSFQLSFLHSRFLQLSKDVSVIQKEVINEYDVKYVHPRTQPLVRDVGTQFTKKDTSNAVDIYTPVTIINKGFRTNPNPNYLSHIGPQAVSSRSSPTANRSDGSIPTLQTPAHLHNLSSPVQPRTALRQPQFRPTYQQGGDGGSLGVHTHAQSPLKKSASTNFAGGFRERERSMSPAKREGSPLKRSSLFEGSNGFGLGVASGPRISHFPRQHGRRESDRF